MSPERFRVRPGERVRLKDRPTRVAPLYRSKADYQARLDAQIRRLRKLQNLLYADDRRSLLLIFQAMDAAGKDSCIKHVMLRGARTRRRRADGRNVPIAKPAALD
jgi:polyphosphate kinase 2 (PPK2 family)